MSDSQLSLPCFTSPAPPTPRLALAPLPQGQGDPDAGPARHWVAVASAEHVRIGRAQGFMQVCHGKAAPLRRLRPGDQIAYYSPTNSFGGKDVLQAFTALGTVRAGLPYLADMGGGFHPWRRDVCWLASRDAAIRPLLPRLGFSAGKPNWGYLLRFGLFEVHAQDMALISEAMQVTG